MTRLPTGRRSRPKPSPRLERLVSAAYPLERYEEAVAHAAAAGRRGSVKIVFDLRRKSRLRSPIEEAE